MFRAIKQEVSDNGFAFVKQFSPGANAETIANALGLPLTPWDARIVQDLVPRIDAAPNTYSGIYGLGKFPFHTDLAHWRTPPRYLLLRCVIGYADVPTLLLDRKTIFDDVTLDILTRAIFKPRRPRGGIVALLRLCEPIADDYCFRWDQKFLRPASKIGEIADQRIREILRNCRPISVTLAEAGDILLIDNWRMLHSRSPIPVGRENRKIQRAYLEALR